MPLVGRETVRIPLTTEGEWVEVKQRLGRGDEIAIQRAIVGDVKVAPGKALPELAAGQYLEAAEFATLDVALVAWSFEEALTPENIRRLEGPDVDLIKARLNELYPSPRESEARGNSSGSGLASSAESEPLPLSLVG